jgi:hypothetical protein
MLVGGAEATGAPNAGTSWRGGVLGTLQYASSPQDWTFDGSVTSFARISEADAASSSSAHSAQATVSTVLGRSARLVATQSATYSPYFQLMLIPPVAAAIADVPPSSVFQPEFDTTSGESISYRTNIGLTQLGVKNRFRSYYDFAASTLASGNNDTRVHQASALFERQVSRYRMLRLGYTLQHSREGVDAPAGFRTHDILLGGGYERPLSFSRRTTVGVSGGSSMIEAADREFRLLVDGTLRHEMGRTWVLRSSYHQGAQFAAGFAAPFYARTTRANLTGLVSRRIDFSVDAAYVRGELQAAARQNPYTSVQGSARLRFAIARGLAAFTEGVQYSYRFEASPRLPGGIAPQAWRRSVRVGIDYAMRLYTPRNADAAR